MCDVAPQHVAWWVRVAVMVALFASQLWRSIVVAATLLCVRARESGV
jgi:hypothetical protein